MHAFFKSMKNKYSFIALLPILIISGCGVESGSTAATATAVSTGYGRSCALIPNGAVLRCWGIIPASNTTTTIAGTPAGVAGITNATAISISDVSGHICVIQQGGAVSCWGPNANGQLGNGTTIPSFGTPITPILVNGPIVPGTIPTGTPLIGATAVSAGGSHSCALIGPPPTTIQCWGANAHGQLGTGTTVDSSGVAPAVNGITSAAALSAGGDTTCAVLSGGTIQCWGANSNGQLGNGSTTDSSSPVAVTGITTATLSAAGLSVGLNHTCVVLLARTVQCWGQNNIGQLGNGTLTDSAVPVAVSGITNATAVSAGTNHTCALLSDSTVKCWGLNNSGQLGNGTNNDSLIPVAIYFYSNFTAISAGVDQTCGLLAGGAVLCWGLNNFAQLGNGTTTDSSIPIVVRGF